MVASDRGQVLLLGGLAIAIVFLTAIPLSNSLVVTESASTSETVGDIDSAAEREAGVERGIRTLINTSDNRRLAALNRSVRNFTRYYTRVTAQRDGVYVNVTLNATTTEGNITEQRSDSDFKRPGGSGDQNNWDLARNVDDIAIFNMTMESNTGSGRNLDIVVTGASGTTNKIDADGPTSGPLTINRTYGSGPTDTICRGTTVELDLVRGTCDGATSGSLDPITTGLDEPYRVEFKNGNSVTGIYTFASTGQFPSSSYSGSGQTSRYGVRPVFDVRYVGPDLSYSRTLVIDGDGSSTSAAVSPSDAVLYTGTGSGLLKITGDNNSTSEIGTSKPIGLGPANDTDSDGTIEIPYVDGDGDLNLTSDEDETPLADDSNISGSVQSSETRLAVGTWNGSDQSVFFTNKNEDTIYRTNTSGPVVEVATPDGGASGVIGPADIVGDSTAELIFLGSSDKIRYLENDGGHGVIYDGAGQNTSSVGGGSVADYDEDDSAEVALVDGGNNIVIADATSNESLDDSNDFDSGSAPSAHKAPPTAADVDGDEPPELVYLAKSGLQLRYLDNIEGSGDIVIRNLTTASGDAIYGDDATGVT